MEDQADELHEHDIDEALDELAAVCHFDPEDSDKELKILAAMEDVIKMALGIDD